MNHPTPALFTKGPSGTGNSCKQDDSFNSRKTDSKVQSFRRERPPVKFASYKVHHKGLYSLTMPINCFFHSVADIVNFD